MNPNQLDDEDDEDITLVSGGFLYPDGTYPAFFTGVARDVSGAGNRMLVFDFLIPSLKATVKKFVAMTDGAIWGLTPVAEAVGAGHAGDTVNVKKFKAALGAPVLVRLEKTTNSKGKDISGVEEVTADPSREKMVIEKAPF